MKTRDDELLDVLAASIGPPPDAEPSWAEISHLHRVIDTGRGWSGRNRAPFWRIRRPLTAAVAGFLVLGGASAAATASGAVMPQPVRVAARAVGLPVDSPALAETKGALGRLRTALATKPLDPTAVRAHAQDVRDRLARLSADDRAHLQDEANFLLAAADAALAPPPGPLGSPAPASPATGDPGPAPAKPAPSADDHGRGSGTSAAPEGSDSGSGRGQSGDDHGSSSATPDGAGNSGGPGPSASQGEGEHTATTSHVDNSGHDGGSDSGGSDGGSSHDGGGGSTNDGGGHSGPG